jgi:hypothetical protein
MQSMEKTELRLSDCQQNMSGNMQPEQEEIKPCIHGADHMLEMPKVVLWLISNQVDGII